MPDIPYDSSYVSAWEGYKSQIAQIASSIVGADIIEIGAGRAPLFDASDLPPSVASYTISDISKSELDRAPGQWERICFDACGDVAEINSRYDLAFSKMLAEHVPDGCRFHSNLFQLLKPGGLVSILCQRSFHRPL